MTEVKINLPQRTPLATIQLKDWFWLDGMMYRKAEAGCVDMDGNIHQFLEYLRVTKINSVAVYASNAECPDTVPEANKIAGEK